MILMVVSHHNKISGLLVKCLVIYRLALIFAFNEYSLYRLHLETIRSH